MTNVAGLPAIVERPVENFENQLLFVTGRSSRVKSSPEDTHFPPCPRHRIPSPRKFPRRIFAARAFNPETGRFRIGKESRENAMNMHKPMRLRAAGVGALTGGGGKR
jgi:hypothetical protein